VVLYSINVFLTFSLSLLGLCIYWWRNRGVEQRWWWRLLLSLVGLMVTSSILLVTLMEKFAEGGWVTILITSLVIGAGLLIKKHYGETRAQMRKVDQLFAAQETHEVESPPALDLRQPTAVFMVGRNRGAGMHTMLWVQRLFPGHFKNFVFLTVGEVDSKSYGGVGALERMQQEVADSMSYFVNFCHNHGLAASAYSAYGTDTIAELTTLAEKAAQEYPDAVFFASNLIFVHDNWFTRMLHNQTAFAMQRRLHLRGMQMVILPMKIQ
jgi:K+ transporter